MRALTERMDDMMTAIAKFTKQFQANHMMMVQDLKQLKREAMMHIDEIHDKF